MLYLASYEVFNISHLKWISALFGLRYLRLAKILKLLNFFTFRQGRNLFRIIISIIGEISNIFLGPSRSLALTMLMKFKRFRCISRVMIYLNKRIARMQNPTLKFYTCHVVLEQTFIPDSYHTLFRL